MASRSPKHQTTKRKPKTGKPDVSPFEVSPTLKLAGFDDVPPILKQEAPIEGQAKSQPDPLWPDLSLDEWRKLDREARNPAGAQFAKHTSRYWSNNAQAGCAKAVFCETEAVLRRNPHAGDDLNGKLGITKYKGAACDQGTWLGVDAVGGNFIRVIIKLRIELNVGRAGRRNTEGNRVVRRERENANPPKRVSFKRLPIEFMLIHEEVHAAEICAEFGAIVRAQIQCGMTPQQFTAMKNAMNQKYQNMLNLAKNGNLPNDPGGIQGSVEERVRRKAWEEWDKRHPNYSD